MERLIGIDRLCNDLMERWSIADKKKEDLIRAVMADVVTPIVVSQPIVDAVPVRHGQWIIKDNPGTGWYRVTCSECGEDVTSTVPVIGFFPNCKVIWNFCPDCGAKMDGKDGDNEQDKKS